MTLASRIVARYLGASPEFVQRLATDEMKVISNAGYKDLTGILRIPIARITDPKTHESRVIVGNEAIDKAGVRIKGKPYMDDARMEKLFSGEVVVEEKVDGHPTIIIFGGYTFFCESLQYRHTVQYDGVPFSRDGWPEYTPVYDIIDGEHEPPYKPGGAEKWLSRWTGASPRCSKFTTTRCESVSASTVEPRRRDQERDVLRARQRGALNLPVQARLLLQRAHVQSDPEGVLLPPRKRLSERVHPLRRAERAPQGP